MISLLLLLLLIGFIKVSLHYNNPLVLAGLYTVATTLISAMSGVKFDVLFISATITFGLMWLFFSLLDRYEDSSLWWMFVMVFPVFMLMLSSVQ